MHGNTGNDAYIFNPNFGQDIIIDAAGDDIVSFTDLLTDDVDFIAKYSRYGGFTDLIINVKSTSESIRIQRFYESNSLSADFAIEKLIFMDGSEIHAADVFSYLPDPIMGTENNDSIYSSDFDDNIQALDGNDYVYAYGGDDTLIGGQGSDSLYGENDNDTLIGGLGNDLLYGGKGNDTYIFEGDFGEDYIFDSLGTNDKVELKNLLLTDVEFQARHNGDANLTNLILKVNNTNNSISMKNFFNGTNYSGLYGIDKFVFKDGTEVLAAEVFDLLARTIQGTEKGETIHGSNFDETIYGFGGDDYILPYKGKNYVDAGAGNDFVNDYMYRSLGNSTILGGTGDDNIQTSNGFDFVDGGANNDYIYTGGYDDTIIGGSGQDSLYGDKGNDTYIYNSGDGQDIIYDDYGNDTIIFRAGILESQTIFTSNGNNLEIIFNGNGNSDKITIQNHNFSDNYKIDNFVFTSPVTEDTLLGGAGNDTLTGNSLSQLFIGFDGNDQIFAKAGNDILVGGAGNDLLGGGTGMDTMNGGVGNDSYYVDNIGDVISDTDGYDCVRSKLNYTLSDNLEKLILQGSAITAVGNDLNNSLLGNSENNTIIGHGGKDYLAGLSGDDSLLGGSGNDYIDGGKGIDTMIGGAGNDKYIVDNSADIISDSEGKEFVTAYADYTLSANLEHLHMAGRAVNGTGNNLNNLMAGTSGDNFLSGKSGDDQLFSKAGNDTVDGGSGNDYLAAGLNDDLYLFKAGDGDDFINDTGSDSGDTIRFASDINKESIAFFMRGTSLDIKYGAGDVVTVYKYDNPANSVETIEHSTGISADVGSIINHIATYETANDIDFRNVDQVSNHAQLMNELQVYWT